MLSKEGMDEMTEDRSDLSTEEKRAPRAKLRKAKQIEPRRYPVSFPQQRLWFLEQLYPGSSTNNIPAAIRMKGSLNVPMLERSFNEIVRRHETLRTTFDEAGGQAVQVVAPEMTLSLPVLELGGQSVSAREDEVNKAINREATQPFDLVRGPLLRVSLLRLDEQEQILLLNMHHIISDWLSMRILLGELSECYSSFCLGTAPSLTELPVQYGDFARRQQEELQNGAMQAGLSYWAKKLGGAPLVLDLPTDHPRPAIRTSNGAYEYLWLSEKLSDGLKSLSRGENVTLFMTLLAAFETLLYRYSGQTDFIIGAPYAARDRSELEGLIGYFANTVALRADLSGDPSFRELLCRARETTFEADTYQRVPFEKLVETLRPERDLSQTPLFQVMFAFDHGLVESVELPGLSLSSIEVNSGTAKFDMTLFMRSAKGGLRACLQYSTDLFEETTIKRMLGGWERLLEGILADPSERITRLPVLSEKDRRLVMTEWNETGADARFESCIHHLFEAQVERNPDAPAVVYGDEHLTYRELNRRANRLANYLRRRGVGPEVRVGICMERSPELIIGLMAILKAGGAYLPLDPAYPADRLDFILDDSGTSIALIEDRLAGCFNSEAHEIIRLDKLWDLLEGESEIDPEPEVGPTNLSYVIYTSGSTGKPKGAMLHHRGICNRLLWGIKDYHLGETDRVLYKTPISFDVSVWEIFAPLSAGAQLIIAKPGGEQDGDYLAGMMREQGVTHADFVPSMLQLFLNEPGLEGGNRLKRITAAGETLTLELQERFFDRLGADLYNLYGPTEASLAVTYWHCRPGKNQRVVPIGRPMDNIRIYLLSLDLEPVPIRAQGELCIGGVAVGRGYLNCPDLTAERFRPDPFSPDAGARFYKTGDLARHMHDGNIEFLGRFDHQVKVRGFRIELGEIESILLKHPSVHEVVVAVHQDGGGNNRLTAYLVAREGATLATPDLRNFVRDLLPDYMIPSQFVVLDAIPLTSNGKADRLALPRPSNLRPEMETVYLPPRTQIERTMAEIWKEALGVDKVGTNDNFFDLGGHSLLIIQLQHKLKKALGREISVLDLFKYPTIGALAGSLSGGDAGRSRKEKNQDRIRKRKDALKRRQGRN